MQINKGELKIDICKLQSSHHEKKQHSSRATEQ